MPLKGRVQKKVSTVNGVRVAVPKERGGRPHSIHFSPTLAVQLGLAKRIDTYLYAFEGIEQDVEIEVRPDVKRD